MSTKSGQAQVVSNIREVVANVQELITPLISQMGAQLKVNSILPNLIADTHPSLLTQILVIILERLARSMENGQIVLRTELEESLIKIEINGSEFMKANYHANDFSAGILIPEEISIEKHIDNNQVFLSIKLPLDKNKITVLVVEDNNDMALFYRRITEKTRFKITHIQKGLELFEKIEVAKPDIIVLDIMLPDIDGWRLLMRLHQNPTTQTIPVIICSVVRDEALALSLGAALCLSKPVRSRQFLQALIQVSPPDSETMPKDQESS